MLYDNITKLAKKEDKKDKKKRLWEYQQERNKQALVISINTTNILKKKKKKRDVSEITSFNCNKKGYYASNCTKPKMSVGLNSFYTDN